MGNKLSKLIIQVVYAANGLVNCLMEQVGTGDFKEQNCKRIVQANQHVAVAARLVQCFAK